MKKLISAFLACVLNLTCTSVAAFAKTEVTASASTSAPVPTYEHVEVFDDTPFGVIIDANGNIVENIMMTRADYVNNVYTIPAGGELITYQYQPTTNFTVGFGERNINGNLITASGIDVLLEIYRSKTIGGGNRERVVSMPFTTRKYAPNMEYYSITLSEEDIDEKPDYPYYNGKITNLSNTKSLTFRLVVSMNS